MTIQNTHTPGGAQKTQAQKLADLRAAMLGQGLDGYLVPRADAYQSEFPAAHARRLEWLTGFTGSSGLAIILRDQAAVMTDGRYMVQVRQQVDEDLYECVDFTKTKSGTWLADHARSESIIGYDPWLFTPHQINAFAAEAARKSIQLKPSDDNLIDQIWLDQPPPPQGKAAIFPEDVAGATAREKLEIVQETLSRESGAAYILSSVESIAWLLNIRGCDLEYLPVVLSTVIVHENGHLQWFVDIEKITERVQGHLPPGSEVVNADQLKPALQVLCKQAGKDGKPVLYDETITPIWFTQYLDANGATSKNVIDPCVWPRARKTEPEKTALKQAHIQDGIALVKFLMWLEDTLSQKLQVKVTEMDIVHRLHACRAMGKIFQGDAFPTIAAFAENGAIIHYRPDETSNKTIQGIGLLLIDSGGQYHYGTTDITRTYAIGTPADSIKDRYTRVLRGHIAVASAQFPQGTTGAQIDALARAPLWQAGLDYAHGTGHGVGCYLSVHEMAANISPRGKDALHPGMLLSNEPGYYKEGAYGIRLENLVFVQEAGMCEDTGKQMLAFETVSLAPFDKSLIQKDLLARSEIEWLNDYHQMVFDQLSPLLSEEERGWLRAATYAIE